jgi:hypothetical protein
MGGQAAHNLGGNFRCAWWNVQIPEGVLTYASTVLCPPYNTQTAASAPEGYALLGRTINVNFYNNDVQQITNFNRPVLFCYKYTQNDIDLAGDPKNFVVHYTTQLNGAWVALPTYVPRATAPR